MKTLSVIARRNDVAIQVTSARVGVVARGAILQNGGLPRRSSSRFDRLTALTSLRATTGMIMDEKNFLDGALGCVFKLRSH